MTTTSAEPTEKLVAKMDRVLLQAIGREVFSKNSRRQLAAGQLSLPVVVVCDRVAVNGFVLAAVDAEVRLTVTVQIELAQRDAAFDRLLVDGRGHVSPVPRHLPGQSGVD